MSYHRPPGAGVAPSGGRALPELLDYIRQEFDVVSGEAQNAKMQNMEYEGHAHNQIKEMSALRHSFLELEREHTKAKEHYEEEIHRLRRELEMRGTAAPYSESQPSNVPPPQVGHGPSNLFGSITSSAPGYSAGPSARPLTPSGQRYDGPPPTLPSQPPVSTYTSANGWDRERERPQAREAPSGNEHPAKRPRVDDQPPYMSSAPPVRPSPHPSTSTDKHPTLSITVPPLNPAMSAQSAYPGSKTSSAHPQSSASSYPKSAPPVPTHDDNPAIPDQVRSDGTLKKEGADWMTMHNPKVKRSLDVELVHTLLHDSVVCCVKFSPNGKLMATGCNRNTILYDTKTGAKHCTLVDGAAGPKDDNYIRSACFSPDGKLIATGSEDRKIRVWDIASKRIKSVLEGHKNEIYSLVFSPDGRLLYSGSGDQSTRIWDMETNACIHNLVVEETAPGENGQPVDAGVTSVALSPDGRLLAAGSLDTMVRLWDAQSGQLLDKLKGHKDSVYSVAFSADGKNLVSGSLDKTLKLWDISAARLALGQEDGPKKEDTTPADVINTESKTQCISTLVGHKDYVLSVAVATEGSWIVSGSKDRGVSFWDPTSTVASVVLQGHKNSVISIAVSDVGGLLATGSGDWSARIWKFGPHITPA